MCSALAPCRRAQLAAEPSTPPSAPTLPLSAGNEPLYLNATCQGDSGGPLFKPGGAPDGRDLLIGATSWGPVGCTARPSEAAVHSVVLGRVPDGFVPQLQQRFS